MHLLHLCKSAEGALRELTRVIEAEAIYSEGDPPLMPVSMLSASSCMYFGLGLAFSVRMSWFSN